MTYELLTKITHIADEVSRLFDRAYSASMTQDNGLPDEVEMQHQFNLAVMELEKLNHLIWPDENMVLSDVLAAKNEIYNLEDMD